MNQKVKLLVKRLTPTAMLPVRKHPDDMGLDLFVDEVVVPEFPYYPYVAVFKSNIAVCVDSPPVFGIDVRARSSVWERFMVLTNGVGSIDVGYRGSINAAFLCIDGRSRKYEKGERFLQLVLPGTIDPRDIEMIEVDELPSGTRGPNGWGSTGQK